MTKKQKTLYLVACQNIICQNKNTIDIYFELVAKYLLQLLTQQKGDILALSLSIDNDILLLPYFKHTHLPFAQLLPL